MVTNAQARAQFGSAVGNWWHQLSGGNAFVAGQTTAVVASLVVGGAEIKSAVSIAKASEVESVFSKIGVFTKALGKASLENGKSLLTLPGRAVDNIGNKLTDIRELLGGKGLNYAFAHAGEGRSVLNVVGKSADDLPKNGVRNNFSKVVGDMDELGSSVSKELVLKTAPKGYQLPEQAQKILNDCQLTIDDFNRINAKQVKSSEEIALLKELREKVPVPTTTTEMRKVMPTSYVDGMINDPEYANISGFVTDKGYVKDISKVNDIIDSSRLDYPRTLFERNGNYAYVDFTSEKIGKIETPYSPEFGGGEIGEWPFTGSGFTAGENGTMVPEWKGDKVRPNPGSTIHEVINGKDTIVATYDVNTMTNEGSWIDLR